MAALIEFIGSVLTFLGLWANYNFYTEKTVEGIRRVANHEGFFNKLFGSLLFSLLDGFAGVAIGIGNLVDSREMISWGYRIVGTLTPYDYSITQGTKLFIAGVSISLIANFFKEDNEY